MADKSTPEGERIAKVLSRRGVASRREAERLIEAGEVKVNGKTITSPALNVTAGDRITISGHPLPAEEPARLWLYYKPEGLVTSAADEKGRDTVFDHLPEDMPRVMSVGRLDLNSEGLLLLTNDGALKRRLELPSTGWLRKYRVRVNGTPTDPDLEPLRKGITVEGERFQPMQVVLDRVQGANAWLTVGLREGKNREIRRAMSAIGLYVNRLIRVSYGPFRLGELEPGQVEEVRQKVLRDQLGEGGATDPDDSAPRKTAGRKPAPRKDAPRKDAPQKDAPREAPARKPAGTGRLAPGEALKRLSQSWQKATAPASRRTSDDAPEKDSRSRPTTRSAKPASSDTPRTSSTRRSDPAEGSPRTSSRSTKPAASETTPRSPRTFSTRRSDAGDNPSRSTSRTTKPAASDTAPRSPRASSTRRGDAAETTPRHTSRSTKPAPSDAATRAPSSRRSDAAEGSTRNTSRTTKPAASDTTPRSPRTSSTRRSDAGDGPGRTTSRSTKPAASDTTPRTSRPPSTRGDGPTRPRPGGTSPGKPRPSGPGRPGRGPKRGE